HCSLHCSVPLLHSLHSDHSTSIHESPTTETYALSLHDALPISKSPSSATAFSFSRPRLSVNTNVAAGSMAISYHLLILSKLLFTDRKSTRLNSSHVKISYAVFCLKKKTIKTHVTVTTTEHLMSR